MQITIDTSKETLSDLDRAILRLIMGEGQAVIRPQFDLFPTDAGALPVPGSHMVTDNEPVVATPSLWSGNIVVGDVQPPVSLPESPTVASEPEALPAAPPEPVTTLPAYLRNRLPDLPSAAVDEDTDTAGVKWDATLHSESRSKCADGTWRKRRTARNVVVTVTDTKGVEHVCEPVSVPDPFVPPMPSTVTVEATFIPPPPPVALVIPPPPPAAVVTTFRELMEKMTQHMGARRITSKEINDICHEYGIGSLQDCFNNTALIPHVHGAIERAAAKVGV